MTDIVVTGLGAVRENAPFSEPRGAWFDPVPLLGKRGWKYLSPATRYLLAAAKLAIDDARLDPDRFSDEAMGVVVGTNFAAEPVVGRLDEVVVAQGAHMLSPAEAPNFSVNIPASNISMRYGMRAFNLTLTNPMVAGLESVLTLAAAIRRGRAQLGVAGATEERPGLVAGGEGACCLVLETMSAAAGRGATPRVRLAGGWCRFSPAGDDLRSLRAPLAGLLAIDGGELPLTVVADGRLGPRLAELCQELADEAGVALRHHEFTAPGGHYFSVSPLLETVGQIEADQPGLIVAASEHGHVAALRLTR